MRTQQPPPSSRRRPVLSGVLVALLGVLVVGHLVGGWYVSGLIREDVFEPTPWVEDDVELVGIDADTVTLSPDADHDGRARRNEVMGMSVGDAYLRLGPVVSDDGETIVRGYEPAAGDRPAPPVRGFVEMFAFPPDPALSGLDVEEVTYRSPLGAMDAWYLDGRRDEWIVHVHGKGSSPQETLRLMAGVERLGFPQLSITHRNDPGQPPDPGGLLSYGLTEWEDLRAAVDHALAEGASEVFLVGHSSGAAVVVELLARDDSGVTAAILDSPNLDLSRAVDAGAGPTDLVFGIPIPPTLLAMGKLFTELRLDVDWGDFDRLRDADRVRVPLLVFHGTADRTVPVEISRELVERRPQLVTLVEVPGAGHREAWNADPASYEQAVARFLARNTR